MAVATKPAPVVPAKRASRMTLDKVVTGIEESAERIVVFGIEGVGKTRFAAGAPSPIFLRTEDGTKQLDVPRFPLPADLELQDVFDAIATLANEKHQFRTLAIDTLDWLEPLIWAFICKRDNKSDIEDYGFGKGYVAALDEWRKLLAALEALHRRTGMGVVAIAHSWVKAFKNPAGEDYERYEMKLHNKAARLWIEWSDMTAFMDYETHLDTNEKTKRTKGISTGVRLLHTQHDAAWDAKNRFGLPSEIRIENANRGWAEYKLARELSQPRDPRDVTQEILELAASIGGNTEVTALAGLEKAGTDLAKLTNLLVWLQGKEESPKAAAEPGAVDNDAVVADAATDEPAAPAEDGATNE